MPAAKNHKPDCQCPVCKRARKVAAQEAKTPVQADPRDSSEYKRLLTDYEAALERERESQETMKAVQSELDRADIRREEWEALVKRSRKRATELLGRHADAVDALRSTSIVYHRAENHRGVYHECQDILCRMANAAWFTLGEGPGLELAKSDPDTWWDKKERNETMVMQFTTAEELGPLTAEDVEEALGEDDEEPAIPEPPSSGHLVDPDELDEIPDHPAFAGRKVRRLDASSYDTDDPGMPKKAKV